MKKFPKPRLKRKPGVVSIQPGHMYINEHPMASDSNGKKMHMCWPKLSDLTWLEDVRDMIAKGEHPTRVQYLNGKFLWWFKLSCYHGGEGWWFEWDEESNVQRARTYRLYIPNDLQFHPDYEKENNDENNK